MSEKKTSELAREIVSMVEEYEWKGKLDGENYSCEEKITKLLDQVRDEAFEECAKMFETVDWKENSPWLGGLVRDKIRKLKSKGEAK
jgi:hypothetical protein